jgi:ligand-binding sensor domain-containing protein
MKKNIIFCLIAGLAFYTCKKDDTGTKSVSINNLEITSIVIDKSNARWVGTESGLYKSSDTNYVFVEATKNAKVLSLGYKASENLLWVGTVESLYKASVATENLTAEAVDLTNLSNKTIKAAYVDSSLKSWFGTNLGITMHKAGKFKKTEFGNDGTESRKLDLESCQINSIASWDGDYYFATNGNAIYRAYGYNNNVDGFTGASVLDPPYNGNAISDTMFVVFVDSKGRQWMGGTEGIQSNTGHETKNHDNMIYAYDELPNYRVHAVAEAPDGKIWVGTENGISIFDGTTWTTKKTSLSSNFITAIAFDKNGSAWVGTKKGIVNIK